MEERDDPRRPGPRERLVGLVLAPSGDPAAIARAVRRDQWLLATLVTVATVVVLIANTAVGV